MLAEDAGPGRDKAYGMVRDIESGAARGTGQGSMCGLFVTFGAFSMANENLLAALCAVRPDMELETLGVAAAIRQGPVRLARCLMGAGREYGPGLFASKVKLRYGLLRSRAMDRAAGALVRRRAEAAMAGWAGIDFTLQTQSLFNAALPGVPNYVYTDHAALQRDVADWDGRGARTSDAWLTAERAIYADAEHVFGTLTRQILLECYGPPEDRVSVVGGGALPPVGVQTAPETYARRRILFVGVEWERKGGSELLAAFCELRARDRPGGLQGAGLPAEGQDRRALPRLLVLLHALARRALRLGLCRGHEPCPLGGRHRGGRGGRHHGQWRDPPIHLARRGCGDRVPPSRLPGAPRRPPRPATCAVTRS